MTIGPSLPPHLAKRKRDSDDDESYSPPSKIQAASKDSNPTKRILGPSLPPGVGGATGDNSDSESDSEGPAPPSASAKPPTVGPTLPESKPRRAVGPAPPPASLDERPSGNPHGDRDDSDSSDDDDYGPRPPGADDIVSDYTSTQANISEAAASAAPKPQRDEWMLAPPTSGSWTTRVDPTKLKNRKFTSGRAAGAASGGGEISSIWTETPEQKRQRLADEVMGRRAAGGGEESDAKKAVKGKTNSAEDEATARRIAEYNDKHRGQSLVAEHKARKGNDDDEDDPTKRAFDKEKDMAVGGRLSHMKRRELLNKSANFGDRFQKGSFL